MHKAMGHLRLGSMAIRYSQFVPKLYNYCLSLGFKRERMMPSRAFCSDESQGYPVILIAQHFGTFPFDHGLVGGKVAIDRHGPHAHHGEDLIIIQASHTGYDPATRQFGTYPRPRTENGGHSSNCGKLTAVLSWYMQEYRHACENVRLGAVDGTPAVFIDNGLLDETRWDGLFLHLDGLIDAGRPDPLLVLSTSKAFAASDRLMSSLPQEAWSSPSRPIGAVLTHDLFHFQHQSVEGPEGQDMLEEGLQPFMPELVTSPYPALDAARCHTQIEFDRTYRSIQREPAFQGKNVLLVSGVNIDIAPREGLQFPLTKFVPWAAYAQFSDGRRMLLEQDALFEALAAQSAENPDQTAFDAAIKTMAGAEGIELPAI